MAHSHSHHDHGPSHFGRAFAIGVALNVAFVATEAAVGFSTGSLALLADAGHNLSDVFGLLIAWGAFALARLPRTPKRTYGWGSSTILAALLNGLLLLIAVGGIVWEAVRRFQSPAEVPGGTIILVAAIGVVINTLTALLFLRGRHADLNLRGAYLHMAADAAVSLGVVLAGLGIWLTNADWLDPAVSLLIAAVILWSTWSLLCESFDLILHAVPADIDAAAVEQSLRDLPGVAAVHDLHIWAMTTTDTALTAHLVKPEVADDDVLLSEAGSILHDRFGIEHVTLQIERNGATSCGSCD